MIDREKVISRIEEAMLLSEAANECKVTLGYGTVEDALALLKAQEPMEMSDAELMDAIRKAPIIVKPAVDAAPVVHARWIKYPLCLGYVGAYSEYHIVCSNCKTVWSIIDNETERFEHCPHCGADMRGDNYEK